MADGPRPDGDFLFIGLTMTPIGLGLVAFAVGTHCEPTPCPSVGVLLGFLAIALVGTVLIVVSLVRRGLGHARNGS